MKLTLSSTKHETSDTPLYTRTENVTDKVGPHSDLLDEFPYLGPPHNTLKQL